MLMQGLSVIDLGQNFTRAVIQQLFRQRYAKRLGILRLAATFTANHLRAVRRANQRTQPQLTVS